jgi:hypothetical protein
MDQKLTDDLTTAAARWLSHALTQLNAEQQKTWDAVMAGHLDARVLIRFREGSLVLEAVDDVQQRRQLYREQVPPLRDFGTEPTTPKVQ